MCSYVELENTPTTMYTIYSVPFIESELSCIRQVTVHYMYMFSSVKTRCVISS